jgi:hypothetical protein
VTCSVIEREWDHRGPAAVPRGKRSKRGSGFAGGAGTAIPRSRSPGTAGHVAVETTRALAGRHGSVPHADGVVGDAIPVRGGRGRNCDAVRARPSATKRQLIHSRPSLQRPVEHMRTITSSRLLKAQVSYLIEITVERLAATFPVN